MPKQKQGPGRPLGKRWPVRIWADISEEQHKTWLALGGYGWLRAELDKLAENNRKISVITESYTDEHGRTIGTTAIYCKYCMVPINMCVCKLAEKWEKSDGI